MSRVRHQHHVEIASDDDALRAEVASLRASLEAMAVVMVEQREINAALAGQLIEVREDVAGLLAVQAQDDDVVGDNLAPIKVAAFETNFDRETIRRWAQRGHVGSVRRGAAWLIDMPSLRQYVAKLRRPRLVAESRK